ncbi:efflux RND transporter periplasmic adaptor subunit [Halopseudomonas pelagia]|uniref:Efflux RND transporter periplasmic adaptor subunit n=1 Tax=Halopseudomonas pelagia TaxID=553151 RepID=A0AA91U657_9GAMM|nr:efflux RND transporter periplasmic adaptor subunit [Halopseudomonas pelagia]PCD01278.1 efflux transporter periplasmic adaptor subunit [Halopseudomonas pelagia]QFY57569.1 efflux RND transporter periplasmic adaptor subunit [Halopseudomonas pelagia]
MSTATVKANALILALLASVVFLNGCGPAGSADAAISAQPHVVPVRAVEVTGSVAAEPLRFAGSVRARDRASLTFQVGGVLRSRQVEIGQQVQAGEVLAALYNPELVPARDAARARLNELQAQAEQARREQQRGEQLFERGVLSTQELEQQSARLAALDAGVGSARAALKQSEQLSAESQLRAPFTGRVEALLVEPGEFVAPGQAVMRLASSNGLEVEVRVPAHLIGDLVVGQTLPVWSSLTGSSLTGSSLTGSSLTGSSLTGPQADGRQAVGRLLELGQGASQAGVLYPMVVSLDSTQFRSGDAVEVGIERNMGDALRVPLSAVMRSADGLAVFQVTEEGKVKRVPVSVSAMQGEQAILSNSPLKQGDQVVYAGLTRLADGDAVELLP